MSTALDLLVRLHNDGVRLRAVSGEELEYEGPEDLVTEEAVADLKKHKAALLGLVAWNEEQAFALIREALAYLAKRYAEGSDLSELGPWENRLNEAYSWEDMGGLRAAVRGFVYAGLAAFGEKKDA